MYGSRRQLLHAALLPDAELKQGAVLEVSTPMLAAIFVVDVVTVVAYNSRLASAST